MSIMKPIKVLSDVVLIIFGSFLIVDSIFLKLLSFNYSAIGLSAIDPFINHWMVGIVFIFIGILGLIFMDK